MIFLFLTIRVFLYIDIFWNCKDLFADNRTICHDFTVFSFTSI